jgi:hypothetical protein
MNEIGQRPDLGRRSEPVTGSGLGPKEEGRPPAAPRWKRRSSAFYGWTWKLVEPSTAHCGVVSVAVQSAAPLVHEGE